MPTKRASKNERDLVSVTAECGNKISAQFFVEKSFGWRPEDFGYLMLYINLGATNQTTPNEPFEAVLGTGESSRYPLRIKIEARFLDGKPAGEINGPGAKDDILTIRSDAETSFLFHAGQRGGEAILSASLLDDKGNVVLRSDPTTLFVMPSQPTPTPTPVPAPTITVRNNAKSVAELWTSVNGTWQRDVAVVAQQGWGMPIASTRMKLQIVPQEGAAAGASWLSAKSGTTDEHGVLTVRQFWKWVPGASLQIENYPIRATIEK